MHNNYVVIRYNINILLIRTDGNEFAIWSETVIGFVGQRSSVVFIINTLYRNVNVSWTVCVFPIHIDLIIAVVWAIILIGLYSKSIIIRDDDPTGNISGREKSISCPFDFGLFTMDHGCFVIILQSPITRNGFQIRRAEWISVGIGSRLTEG